MPRRSITSHGQHIIGHGGDTQWFHTQLALFPEHDLGVFVSTDRGQHWAPELSFPRTVVEAFDVIRDRQVRGKVVLSMDDYK